MRSCLVCTLLACTILLGCGHVWAQYEPFAVEVDPQDVSFIIDGPPGMYEAAMPLNVSVSSGFSEWSLHCQASPMVEITNGWILPASRIFIDGGFQDVVDDGDGLLTLDQPILVGQGSFTGPEFVLVSVLSLSFQSEWQDKPGTYSGEITFTYLAVP